MMGFFFQLPLYSVCGGGGTSLCACEVVLTSHIHLFKQTLMLSADKDDQRAHISTTPVNTSR